ncbi:hypothetical protein [Actinocorallia longicatena]|uniref:DNA recombination protein RmuC n=1 Tax=Actinocorallia longicatena TaxID=111803 RepID=A0ABP6Q9I1_9ACTN
MTIALVVLCMAVGALELYAGRQAKNQTQAFVDRVDELRAQVRHQNRTLEVTGQQISDELSEVRQQVLPGIDYRVRQHGGRIDELASLLHRTEEYIRAQAIRLHELEKQRDALAELRGRLADMENTPAPVPVVAGALMAGDNRMDAALTRITELEHHRTQVLDLQRDLSQALEEVEGVVTDLLTYTSGELDRAITTSLDVPAEPQTTVAGSLMSADPALREVLADVYERCVVGSGLEVQFKHSDDALTRYYLTGRVLEELGGGYTALLISLTMDVGSAGLRRRLPSDEASVKALLRAVYESDGAVAQIGPLVVVRTREPVHGMHMVGAVLTHVQSLEFEQMGLLRDPAAVAARLSGLPAHQFWDLTAWAGRPPSGG